MSMGSTPEEAMAPNHTTNNTNSSSNNNNNEYYSQAVAKGKRTKRQRTHQFPAPAPATPTSSTSSSAEFSGSTTTTEEEEDMANCLILLAQGRSFADGSNKPELSPPEEQAVAATAGEKFTSRRFAEAATTTNGKAGFYVYECKTCNKCFPSFQALGGHRASHKKLKITPSSVEEKKSVDEDGLQISIASFTKPIVAPTNNIRLTTTTNTNNTTNNNKSRVHECSICGSEFTSGQALGGHMRRHRPAAAVASAVPESPEVNKKEKNILSLDLNLPAPSDDDRGDFPNKSPSSFSFSGKQSIIFSASPLVDCHY